MEALDKLIESSPKIIKEAAKSPRGFSCLIVLALSVVGVLLFQDASDIGRIVAYISLIGSFVFFGILVFRQSPGAPVSQAAATATGSTESAPITVPAEVQVSTARLPITGSLFFGRKDELNRLDEAWVEPATHVISLVAWGGVGKTALTKHWLGEMAQQDYCGAERVFAWSFHRQGTRDTEVSGESFIDAALRWFGDDAPEAGSPWDKGERLAALVRTQRTLLVLDGLEPLQNPPGPDEGHIKDPAVAALLGELAASNPGLCVVSTRVPIADLSDYAHSTALIILLDELSEDDGAALLQALDITGSKDELHAAVREYGGHALALTLLGTYLRDVCGGDVARRREVSLLAEDEQKGGHARRVMESYEHWLGDGPELAVLRMVCLFDRPAEPGVMAALRAPPAIPALTGALDDLSDADWQRALARLRRSGLVADEDIAAPGALDVHPLVREYFGEQLQVQFIEAWREGHSRLYEYLKETTKEFPDTLEEMMPLYQAVAHGCQAGRHQEAFDEVYLRRTQRGSEAYSQFTLGAISADLAAVSCFFDLTISDQPWHQPVAGLTPIAKGFVLNEAGWDLRSLGRLAEGIQPMKKAMEVRSDAEDWIGAANSAANLSTIHLQVGELDQALLYAQQGVILADHCHDLTAPWGPQHSYNRAFLGEALHKAGRMEDAEKAFRDAETIQKERVPKYPLLYAVMAGFLYCDFLLDQGEYQHVKERAKQTLEWNTENERLRDIALDHLSLGRAHMFEALREGTGDLSKATHHIEHAVDGLRQARQQDHLLLGLLARAVLHRLRDAADAARSDLDQVLTIAGRGGMRLHEADARLEYARLHLDDENEEAARESLAAARKIVTATGYHRRDGAAAELESQLAG